VFFNIFFPLESLMVTEFPFLDSSLWNLVECSCHFLFSFFLIIPAVNNLIRSNDQHKGLFYLFVQCHDPLSSGYFTAWYNLTVLILLLKGNFAELFPVVLWSIWPHTCGAPVSSLAPLPEQICISRYILPHCICLCPFWRYLHRIHFFSHRIVEIEQT